MRWAIFAISELQRRTSPWYRGSVFVHRAPVARTVLYTRPPHTLQVQLRAQYHRQYGTARPCRIEFLDGRDAFNTKLYCNTPSTQQQMHSQRRLATSGMVHTARTSAQDHMTTVAAWLTHTARTSAAQDHATIGMASPHSPAQYKITCLHRAQHVHHFGSCCRLRNGKLPAASRWAPRLLVYFLASKKLRGAVSE